MANIQLSFAINLYEHVRDLLDGTEHAEDIDFTSICLVIWRSCNCAKSRD